MKTVQTKTIKITVDEKSGEKGGGSTGGSLEPAKTLCKELSQSSSQW